MGTAPRITLWIVSGFILIAVLIAYQSGAFTDRVRDSRIQVDSLHLYGVVVGETPRAMIVLDNTTRTPRRCSTWLRLGPSDLFVGNLHADPVLTRKIVVGADRTLRVEARTTHPITALAAGKLATATAGVRCGKERSRVVTASTVVGQ